MFLPQERESRFLRVPFTQDDLFRRLGKSSISIVETPLSPCCGGASGYQSSLRDFVPARRENQLWRLWNGVRLSIRQGMRPFCTCSSATGRRYRWPLSSKQYFPDTFCLAIDQASLGKCLLRSPMRLSWDPSAYYTHKSKHLVGH